MLCAIAWNFMGIKQISHFIYLFGLIEDARRAVEGIWELLPLFNGCYEAAGIKLSGV